MLQKAVRELFPDKILEVHHALPSGLYCELLEEEAGEDGQHPAWFITDDDLDALRTRMQEIVAADLPFGRRKILSSEVTQLYRSQHQPDKAELIESLGRYITSVYSLGDTEDTFYGPLVPSTGMLKLFDLVPYEKGMLLLGPNRKKIDEVARWEPQPKLFQAFTDYINFNKIIRLGDVGELNRAIKAGYAPLLINVVEALHNKHFIQIADEITRRYHEGGARVVLIAGQDHIVQAVGHPTDYQLHRPQGNRA